MLTANEVSWYINNQIIIGLVSHFHCYLNRSVWLNCPPIDLHLNLHTQTIRPRGPVKYSLRRNFVLSRGGFHYFISALADRGVNHVDSACLKYRMQTLILCIFGWGWRHTVPAAFFSSDVGPRNELWLAGSQQRCLRGGKRERILSVPLQSLQITRRWAFPHALLLMY